MTVSTTQSRVVYAGNGIRTVFPFGFIIPEAGDEQITYTDAFGNSTVLASTLYSVSGFNSATGGSVQYPLSGTPIPVGTSITIARNVAYVQGTSLQNQGAFLPHSTEGALDYLEMEIQQLEDGLSRALVVPPSDINALNSLPSVAQRANTVLGFDANGQPVPIAAQGVTVVQSNQAVYYTRAVALTSQIPTSVQAIVICGRALPGDCPPAVYAKMASAPSPSHAWQFQSADGAWWQFSEAVVRPEQLSAVGATDDSAAINTANACAVALGIELVIDRLHTITSAVTITYARFAAAGRLKPSTSNLITLVSFDAPLHQFIFDFSSVSSGTGFTTGSYVTITSRALTPQMFGAVENSPSSATANVKAFNDLGVAWVKTGLDVDLTPCLFDINGQVAMDWGGSAAISSNYKGRGANSILNFSPGVASPNMKFSDISGTYDGGITGGTRSEFYGEVGDFQVWGSPIVQATGYSVGSVTLQFGEQGFIGPSIPSEAADTLCYLNGITLARLVVKNNNVYSGTNTGGGYGLFLSGLTTFVLSAVTCNAGGAANDGSAAIVMQACNYGTLLGCSTGNAGSGIFSPLGYSSTYQQDTSAIKVIGHDFEVLGSAAITNYSQQFQNNTFQGGFAQMPCVVNSIAGSSNVIEPSTYGGITSSTFAQPLAALGTWGGYGFTIKQPNVSFVGAYVPYGPTNNIPASTSGGWQCNIFGQDAIVYCTVLGIGTVYKRGFTDRTSAGVQVATGGASGTYTTYPVIVKAGESVQINGTSPSWYWEPKE